MRTTQPGADAMARAGIARMRRGQSSRRRGRIPRTAIACGTRTQIQSFPRIRSPSSNRRALRSDHSTVPGARAQPGCHCQENSMVRKMPSRLVALSASAVATIYVAGLLSTRAGADSLGASASATAAPVVPPAASVATTTTPADPTSTSPVVVGATAVATPTQARPRGLRRHADRNRRGTGGKQLDVRRWELLGYRNLTLRQRDRVCRYRWWQDRQCSDHERDHEVSRLAHHVTAGSGGAESGGQCQLDHRCDVQLSGFQTGGSGGARAGRRGAIHGRGRPGVARAAGCTCQHRASTAQ